MFSSKLLLAALLFVYQPFALGAPASSAVPDNAPLPQTPSQASTAPTQSFTAGLTSDDPNDSLLDQFQNETPEAIRGTLGATVIGPQNVIEDRYRMTLKFNDFWS